MGGRIALLIGTGSFRDASLQELDTPASDVRELAALLRDPYVAGFDPVIELIDASTQQVGREIAHTLERRRKDDLVLLYYSGRVLLDDEGQLHLAMVDTELDLLSPTSISAAFIAAEMDRCRSRRQVLILDGRAGTGFAHGVKAGMNDITAPLPKLTLPDSGDLARAFLGDGHGRAVIAACEGGPHGLPRESWPPPPASQLDLHPGNCRNSWFTHGLLEGLRGAADTDRDGRISIDDLYHFAHASFVQHMRGSQPDRLGELAGDVLIGYAPTRPSAPPKSTPSTRVPKPGSLVSDRYRILAPLDEGGGTMFAGIDERSGRKVSIKCLRPPESIDANALERFLREAQMAGQIDHANVVAIYDVGFEGNSAFIVMEPLEGETLAALLRRKPRLAVGEALEILLPAVRAVEAAHAHGVIHRGLSTENVFIKRHPEGSIAGIKVLGFGVSTALDRGKQRGGALIGSPHYMSPEQVLGGAPLDVRTDVYAFGVMLYEALTGHRPFDADNHAAVLWKLGNGETEAPRALCPELPAALEAIVLQAMATDRGQRYAELEPLRLALEGAAREQGLAAAAQPLPPSAASAIVRESLPPSDPKIETPAVFVRRAGRQASGSRNWAYALSLAVVLAGTAGWLLSDDELAGEAPPEVVPIAPAAATQPPPAAAPQPPPIAADPPPSATRTPPTAPAEPAAAGAPAAQAAAPMLVPPPPGQFGTPNREVDAGYLDPVPRAVRRAARQGRAEGRAAKQRELEQQHAAPPPDAGATLLIKRLPEPGDPVELPPSTAAQ